MGRGMVGLGSKVVRRAHDGAARVIGAGARMRKTSVERYLIGVRPVLINVFVGDLVEFFARPACEPHAAAVAGRWLCRASRLENRYAIGAMQC
ncbi:hypothetical protein F7R21_28710 [Burkholderia latens]|uniref:Uncharacterized protein n=1 Tax=Burkholderia latens TaxID=488446 RepID=A0A6H9SJL5_9BURK|nr:hypothetical protein [Burkholderia latens]KAB0632886.1 hypothetical protein F7R21_28710 [Burkholderia latens]